MSSKISIVLVWVCVISLLAIGLVMVASTSVWSSEALADDPYLMLRKQVLFSVAGLACAFLVSCVDYRKFERWVYWGFFGVCFLLLLCFVPGIGREINGERRWIDLGMQFQPSEIAKICMMGFLAHWYARYREYSRKLVKGFVLPGMVFAIPLALIFFEKDMGTASALAVAGACVMFAAGANLWALGGSAIGAFAALCVVVQESGNRMERIAAWMDLEAHRLGAGLQQFQAWLALSHGGWTGQGLGESTVKHGTLPFAHTDFIFAPLGEEFGFVGTMTVLLLFSFFAFGGIFVALQTRDIFGRLLAVGIVAMVFCPAMLNIAVVTSALPNSGLPLPFISFGGTNLVFTLISIGVLTSIQRFSTVAPLQFTIKHRAQNGELLT